MQLVDYVRLSVALGPHRVARTLLHRARLRSGAYLRSSPPGELRELSNAIIAAVRNPFAAPSALRLDDHSAAALRESAERIVGGELQYFSRRWLRRPPTWRTHPITGYRTPDLHWSECSEFVAAQGDVKWIWEPSRFEWAYVLGRAWRLTHDERIARTFWMLLEDWMLDNPPNFGINWRCAQECSLRMIALVWAGAAFRDSTESTAPRVRMLWSLVAALAARVQVSTGYALSQNNNHGLTEACALFLAGTCLIEHPSAASWCEVGWKLFQQQIFEQIAPDGFYIQNSFNYTRLALRTCIVFMLTARMAGQAIEAPVLGRIRAAASLLRAVIEPEGGRVPNFGANDGANVLSLSSAGYLDFRAVTQSVWYLLCGRKLFAARLAADEELLWLGIADPSSLEHEPPVCPHHAARASGYFVLASGESRLHVRCATHRARPGHADMLHVDIWNGAVNIARDCGTFGYNDAKGWGAALTGSAAHNVVVVDGQDQMRKLSRFLWTDWTRAQVIDAHLDPAYGPSFCGAHFGYRRLGVEHRRTIYGRCGDWLVLDDLLFARQESHDLALYWHLDAELKWVRHERGVCTPCGEYWLDVAAVTNPTYEWHNQPSDLPANAESLYYGEVTAGALLVVRTRVSRSMRFVSSLGRTRPQLSDGVALWHDLSLSLTAA